jgi:lipoprotein-anchoring transpeptidase ErfK/SrfK
MDRARSRPTKAVIAAALAAMATLTAGAIWVGVSYANNPKLGAATPSAGGWSRDRAPQLSIDVGNGGAIRSYKVWIDGHTVDGDAKLEDNRIVVKGVQLADGTHRVTVRAKGSGLFGGEMSRSWSFSVDTKVPLLSLQTPIDGYLRSNAVTLEGTTEPGAVVNAAAGDVKTTTKAGGDGVFTVQLAVPDGSYPLQLTARDPAGNSSATSGQLRVDATAPQITLTRDGVVKRSMLKLDATVTDTSSVTTTATLDNRRFTLGTKPAKHLAQGVHWLRITATDEAGNTAKKTGRILVDSTERLGSAALWPGARGNDVKQLQRQLRDLGLLPKKPVTGVYNAATLRAVQTFQSQRSMPVDGIAGVNTIGAMTTRIVIDQSAHLLTLYRAGKATLTFGVAVGQSAYPTPTGEGNVIVKVVDPTWVPPNSDWARDALPIPPGPDNPLGTRWIGLSWPSVGIHGTNDPASIGYSVSHGCIRMAIPEVERLYEMVYVGTPVTITA